jgi:hypothetical protein
MSEEEISEAGRKERAKRFYGAAMKGIIAVNIAKLPELLQRLTAMPLMRETQ